MGQEDSELFDLSDIRFHSVSLGEGLKGFVYVSRKNVSHIFISNSLSPECATETLVHEIFHLKYDKKSYGIGLDKQQEEFEQMANQFAAKNFHRLLPYMNINSI